MLPENAPKRYKDPSVLWYEVEKNEKSSDAQFARTVRFEFPNDWSYELAKDVVRAFCQREIVDKGMCCQYAIHDSENKETGQRNHHVHILLTMRGIDENGRWLPKQKKLYLTDKNVDRIPLIDKKIRQQKVEPEESKSGVSNIKSTRNY
ncbi:MAG: MobA/MobL family protein [Lachnospiraceae bacterium]|nr:MobA/MobL family protein [Lachnospiraceae bacterium]